MKRRSAILAVATFAVAGVMTLGATTFAHAADNFLYVANVYGSGRAGYIAHIDDGDSFRVMDLTADGHGVRGWVLDSNGNVLKSAYNGNGSGNSVSFSYNVLSGRKYHMRVCLVDGASDTTPVKCAMNTLYE